VSATLPTYRRHFAEGRRYGYPSYALGAALRHRFTNAGALACPKGLPFPTVDALGGTVDVGDVGLFGGVHLHAEPGARITIGDGTYLNRSTMVWAAKEVTIGSETMISWDVIITDSEGFGDKAGIGRVEPVSIGDHVWIGAKAVILAGAQIGDGAVIGAGAVITGVVQPRQIVVAQAARPLLDLRKRS